MMADERRLEKRRTLNLLDSRSPSLGPNSLALPPTHHRASTSRAAPSQPIVIYSDDEMEEVKLVPHGYMANGERRAAKAGNGEVGGLDMGARDAIKVALAKLDAEIKSVVAQLEPLQALHTSLIAERAALETQLTSMTRHRPNATPTAGPSTLRKSSNLIDYQSSTFPWSSAIISTLKFTFHLQSFRLCQEGVINAAMDDRDIVCVMPTGGGKSLTYQLPAIMGRKGLTMVISPLLALIWDQVRAMREVGVECVMMTGSTGKAEQNEMYRRMEEGGGHDGRDIRLCYVTPEKISKSKRLMSVLEKVNSDGRLTRFVIDEAHCCSQLGHDFRPDYKKLSLLKTLFPRVPIQAVTATLSTKTMPDLLQILRLPPICDGQAANATGSVFFSAPLFRPNLHYRVITKPSGSKAAIEVMGKWIKQHHPGESGIIYCLSKKDAETVADSLIVWSEGAIKTGVYHAGIGDYEKERIHVNWRKGKVNCICATIAFGLGIDKGDVRYVIHHSMSKSLDGYYQETGRAGRDGKDSDCVLFYRGQDASRLTSLICGDVDGVTKLQEMVRFAHQLKTCRKVAFAKYFSASSHLSTAAWDHPDALSTSTSGSLTTCGICDNCTRDAASIITKDVTIEAWRILRVLTEVQREGGRVTLATLADLVRGLGGGSFAVAIGKGRKRKVTNEKMSVDLVGIAGGKVELNKEDTESLLIHLTLLGYVEESYHATAYAVNVYLIPSSRSLRLSRLSRSEVEAGNAPSAIECTFSNPKARKSSAPRQKGVMEQLVHLSDGGKEVKLDELEPEDVRKLSEWDKSDGPEEALGDEEEEDSDGIGENENGWKVIRGKGSQVGPPVKESTKRAVVLSESE